MARLQPADRARANLDRGLQLDPDAASTEEAKRLEANLRTFSFKEARQPTPQSAPAGAAR